VSTFSKMAGEWLRQNLPANEPLQAATKATEATEGSPATSLTAPVMEDLREQRGEIIELLAHRPVMPAGVRLVSWFPKAAPVKLSRCETVTDTEKFIRTTLMQLAARLSGKKWLDGGWGLSGLLARLEACGCRVALVDSLKVLQ
jgi:hypothetical protein